MLPVSGRAIISCWVQWDFGSCLTEPRVGDL